MKVFLSYSSKDDKSANELDEELRKLGINIIRDKRDLEPLRNITNFMKSISEMDYAIMLISKDYLKSKPCLFEFTEYLKKVNANKTVLPIILKDFKFSNALRNEVFSHIKEETSSVIQRRSLFKKIISFGREKDRIYDDWNDRFIAAWDFITNTKLFSFVKSKSSDFADILAFLNVFDDEIIKELNNLTQIEDEEEQDIAFHMLVNNHPGSYWIINYKAYLCTLKKRYKKAIILYNEFMSKFTEPFDKISSYYNIGVCYYELGNYVKAIEAHKEAIKINPIAIYSHRGLGDVYFKLNDLKKAYTHYLISYKFERNDKVLNNMGAIEHQLGNYTKALEYFKEGLEVNEDNAELYINIAFTYFDQNDPLTQHYYYYYIDEAFKKFPNNFQVLTAFVHRKVPEIGNKFGMDVEELMEILDKSFNLNPDFIDTRAELGYLALLKNSESINIKELIGARELLLETLDMNITLQQRNLIVSSLKGIAILLNDTSLIQKLKDKYPLI